MRIVVTGATGFIGKALCQSLVQDGHEIVALTRSPAKANTVLGEQVTSFQWDGCRSGGWASLAEGAGAIVNLAGENIGGGRWTQAMTQAILQSRLNAGQAVVEAVENAETKPGVVIQASGVGCYGSHGDEVLDESAPYGDDFLSNVARQWETSTGAVETMGVRRVILRTGAVLERDGGMLPRMLLPFRLFVGGPLGDGRQWLSWIHREDEVQALRFLLDNENAQGVFNLTAPEPVTMRDFCHLLGKTMGRPSWLPMPGFVLRLLFGEMADALLLSGQRAIPRRLQEEGFEFKYPTTELALKAIMKS